MNDSQLSYIFRVPFARYVACNKITNMKRYCIERVYREKQSYIFYPIEMYNCSFDIVTNVKGYFQYKFIKAYKENV